MTKPLATIGDLTPDSRNANTGTERGRYMLEQSLREAGAGRSIVVDQHGNVIAGNKTLEVAEALGLPIVVVKTNGTELVVVQREDLDLDDDRARKLAFWDNRAGEVGLNWNAQQIVADLDAGFDLGDMFRDEELNAIVEQAADAMLAGEYRDQFDEEMDALDGLEDATLTVVVPAKHEQEVTKWLANGELKTGAGLGRGVMKRCGLL